MMFLQKATKLSSKMFLAADSDRTSDDVIKAEGWPLNNWTMVSIVGLLWILGRSAQDEVGLLADFRPVFFPNIFVNFHY